ncbi:uncharacterized protein VP01_1373g5 [Puccinia sorghi]|uniref:Uncharacterized protein n=1 Tax=Puccinia sorghi TaxID=27349 RepID=A0A0L6VM48_9BASI|nr:uncharacterized protein VP01_1373g5 [Puccinia sorghi]
MAALGIDLFQRNPVPRTHTSNNIEPQIMEDQHNVSNNYFFSTSFRLFYSKKQSKKLVWKAVKSRKCFKFDFKPKSTSFSNFQQMVAAKCNGQFTSARALIRDTIETGSPLTNYLLSDVASFDCWIDSATGLGKYNIGCGLKLQMEDRGAMEKQAAVAVEVQNHLSTVEAAQQASLSRHRNCDDSDEPDLGVFEDTVNFHMEKIYSKHPPNLKYDRDFPVYIDPQNPNCYFPLTVGTVQTWAQVLNLGANGVYVFSPPLSIKFLLSSKKRKTTQLFGSNEVVQLLRTLLGNKEEGGSPAKSDGNQSLTVPLETDAMLM